MISERFILNVTNLLPPNAHFIGGKWMQGRTGENIPVINPANQELLAIVPRGGSEDIDLAVRAAHEAFPAWRDCDPVARSAILRRWADLLVEHGEQLSLLESLEVGHPHRGVLPAGHRLMYSVGAAEKVIGMTLPCVQPELLGFTLREPFGVCGVISPWNAPAILMMTHVGPALAAGNTVVIKPAEDAPLTVLLTAKLAKEAGVPDGVINVVSGFGPEAGAALPIHPLVRHLSFTGSVETGTAIMKLCAQNIVPLTLELGGKSPQIVFADADLALALPAITRSIVANSGQICFAGTRVIVETSIEDDVVAGISELLKKTRIGPWYEDVDMGPLINEKQEKRVLGYIDVGRREGANMVLGGRKLSGEQYDKGFFVEPTLFEGVKQDMKIAREEIFGPVLSVMSFEDPAHALTIANSTTYGLVSSVWTRDLGHAMQFSRGLESGQVFVNTFGSTGVHGAPFGGYKRSGIGRANGIDLVREYTQEKCVVINAGKGPVGARGW